MSCDPHKTPECIISTGTSRILISGQASKIADADRIRSIIKILEGIEI